MKLLDYLDAAEDDIQRVMAAQGVDRTPALEALQKDLREALSLSFQEPTVLPAAKALRLYVLCSAFKDGWLADMGRQSARIRRAIGLLRTGLMQVSTDMEAGFRKELALALVARGRLFQIWFEARSRRGLGAAIRCFEAAGEEFGRTGFAVEQIRQFVNAADTAFDLGRLGEPQAFAYAEAQYHKAMEVGSADWPAREATEWRVKHASAVGEVAVEGQRSRFEEAINMFEAAIAAAEEHADAKTIISARMNFGGLLQLSRRTGWREDIARAIGLLEAARELAVDVPDQRASIDLTLCALWQNTATGALASNIETAIAHGEWALSTFVELGQAVEAARACQNLAEAQATRILGDREENYRTARQLIADALALVPRKRNPQLWGQFRMSAGRVEMFHTGDNDSRRWRLAARHFRLARSVIPEDQRGGVEDLNLAGVLHSLYRITRSGRDLAEGRSAAERAKQLFEATGDGEAVRRAIVMQGRFAAGAGEWESAAACYDEAIEILRTRRLSGASLDTDARAAGAGSDAFGLGAFAHCRCGRPDIGLLRLLSGKARALSHRLALPPLDRLEDLPDDAVVVAPIFDDEGCTVVIADRQAAAAIDVPGISNRLLTALLFGGADGRPAWADHIESPRTHIARASIDEAMNWLTAHFVGLINAHLAALYDPAAVRVILVPHDGSSSLPWHSAGGDACLSLNWRTCYAATVCGPVEAPMPSSRHIVAVPDPTGDLRGALEEARRIIQLADGQGRVVEPADAELPALAETLRQASHVHFAGHARFNPYDSREAALVLGNDRLLTVAMIQTDLRLDGRPLVTLAGCETGIGDFAERGDERSGLATAFLSVGAYAVIGALWKVSDLATMLLFSEFYRRHLTGEPIDTALAAATRYVRCLPVATARDRCGDIGLDVDEVDVAIQVSDDPAYPFSHPLFWGGFILIRAPNIKTDPASHRVGPEGEPTASVS